jgi:two-component system C4-dicarboxylate transport sensor histidine kinase DctB
MRSAGLFERRAARRTVAGFARKSIATWIALALALLFVVPGAYMWGARAAIQERRLSAEQQLDIYVLGLRSELARYDYLPEVFAKSGDIVALLARSDDPEAVDRVNRYLEEVNRGAQTSAIYVLDLNGVVRAASNWSAADSFVGMDLSFRPYFIDALSGRTGRFYGIGTTSGLPGYYFSQGISKGGRVIGVAAVKVSLDRLEQTWRGARDMLLVTDADGVILLSSRPDWKFRTLQPLEPGVVDRIKRARQFETVSLQPLDLTFERELSEREHIVRLDTRATGAWGGEAVWWADGRSGGRFLAMTRPLSDADWRVIVLWDLAGAEAHARNVSLSAALATALVGLGALYLIQRRRAVQQRLAAKAALERAYDDLERKVIDRTADLTSANEQLRLEAERRQENERVLRTAQDALVHASKLAIIGQMASGVAHELNQPLAALHTLADNTRVFLERGNAGAATENLTLIGQLIQRMGRITGELKTFGRKSAVRLEPVDVKPVVENALFLIEHRLKAEKVDLRLSLPAGPVVAVCDGERLGQILVNLVTNAIDAMKGCPVRRLEIAAREQDERTVISVRDTGPGIAAEVADRLFEPFFTTKAAGAGLGLGLAISAEIARDFGGALRAANHPEGGAAFTVELVTAREHAQ